MTASRIIEVYIEAGGVRFVRPDGEEFAPGLGIKGEPAKRLAAICADAGLGDLVPGLPEQDSYARLLAYFNMMPADFEGLVYFQKLGVSDQPSRPDDPTPKINPPHGPI